MNTQVVDDKSGATVNPKEATSNADDANVTKAVGKDKATGETETTRDDVAGTIASLPIASPRDTDEDLHNLLAALVEQVRATATRMAGDPERETTCHFCGGQVTLWESLLVMQLAGVPAHIECPPETLAAKLKASGPAPDFPTAEFFAAIEARLAKPPIEYAAGTIWTTRA